MRRSDQNVGSATSNPLDLETASPVSTIKIKQKLKTGSLSCDVGAVRTTMYFLYVTYECVWIPEAELICQVLKNVPEWSVAGVIVVCWNTKSDSC